MHQQHMCLKMLKVGQSALIHVSVIRTFSQASLMSMSARVALNAPTCIFPWQEAKIADCESPHDWLMSLAMDLAALCDMWR